MMKKIFILVIIEVVFLTVSCSRHDKDLNLKYSKKSETECFQNVKQSESKDKASEPSHNRNWLIWIFLVAEGVAVVILYRKSKVIDVDISRLKVRMEKRKEDNKSLSDELENIRNQLSKMPCDINNLQQTIPSNRIPAVAERPNIMQSPSEIIESNMKDMSETIYLLHDKNGIMKEVQKSDNYAFFKLYPDSQKGTGKFEFTGNAEKAFRQRSAVLDGVCDIKGNFTDPKEILTVQKGECTKQSDGKWKVAVKAQIILK